jgi:hypothetical protein
VAARPEAPTQQSFRQEMFAAANSSTGEFDVCLAMFDVTMSSQRNWK